MNGERAHDDVVSDLTSLQGRLRGDEGAQTDPDTKHVVAAMEALDFLVVQEIFENETTGGSIPKEFIKPIDEGIKEALTRGILAGKPIPVFNRGEMVRDLMVEALGACLGAPLKEGYTSMLEQCRAGNIQAAPLVSRNASYSTGSPAHSLGGAGPQAQMGSHSGGHGNSHAGGIDRAVGRLCRK